MLYIIPKFRCLAFSSLLAICSGVSCLQAEEIPNVDRGPAPRDTALASDRPTPSPAEIAREVLLIQQEMGGSVVTDRAGLLDWDYARSPVTPTQQAPRWSTHSPRTPDAPSHYRNLSAEQISISHKVNELREAAWQLETTAYGLEKLDLYDQADALREVATRLRRDARVMKQGVGK